jgi:predicted anti-sigma-YlaC factor YlaD
MRMSADLRIDCNLIDAELDRRFEGQTADISQHARQHLQECERCRRLYHWISEELPLADPSPELYREIQKKLQASLKPVSPQPSIRVLAAQFLVVFLLFASPAIGMLGVAGVHKMGLLQLIAIGVVLLLGAALLSLSLSWQMTPGSLHLAPAKVVVPTLAAGFLVGIALLFPWYSPEAFLRRGWVCFKTGLLMALPAATLFWLLVRRGRALAIGTLGATIGAIAGLLGVTVLQIACDRQDAAHLLVWHGGVLVASIVFGLLIARAIELLSRPLGVTENARSSRRSNE